MRSRVSFRLREPVASCRGALTSGDGGGGELSIPSNCTMQAMSTGDRAFFLFLALVILGEMMAGLLLDAVA